MKSIVQPGDEVIVKELDRLGRDKEGIKEEIRWFKDHGVILRILDVPTTLIDFQGQDWIADMVNNILIEVLGAIAQNEREKTHKRQREGIDAMRVVDGKKISAKKGTTYGRQPIALSDDFEKFFRKQKDGELTVTECCNALGISRRTWYNRVSSL
jgi:DNA invertase Pin-like site-specific DNA recombinase